MASPADVNFIWHGNWSGNTATTILPQLISDLNHTTYTNILSSYTSPATKQVPTETLNVGSSYFVTSSSSQWQGASLDGTPGHTGTNSIESIVNSVISSKGLSDPNALYFIMTAPSISVSGFETQFCGWHDSTGWGTNTLGTQFGFIGDSSTQGSGCDAPLEDTAGINGNYGADVMASVLAHETFEAITDPTGNAWWDNISSGNTAGYEEADMCAYQHGATHSSNGANYNVTLNGDRYLLQQQWINNTTPGVSHNNFSGGVCGTALAFAVTTPEPSGLWSLLVGLLTLPAVCVVRGQSGRRPDLSATA